MDEVYISNLSKSSERTIVIACCVFLALTWITVFLRSWVRAGLLRNFGYDDAAMVLSEFVFTAFCGCTIWAVSLGASGDIQGFDTQELAELTKGVLCAFALYALTMIVFKIALSVFYLRIIVRPWQRYTVFCILAINTAYGLVYFFVVIFRCGDPAHYLDNQVVGKCLTNEVLFVFNMTSGVVNAATDFGLAILPYFIIRKAGLPWNMALGAGFVLMLGTVGSIISVVRLPYVKGLAMGPNFFKNAVDITLWSVIEPGIGITAACLATLRPLLKCMHEGTKAVRTRSEPNPRAPGKQPASFSTWRSDQVKSVGYQEVELQQRLEERPTYQSRLDAMRAGEDAEAKASLTKARLLHSALSSHSNNSHSTESGESVDFLRPIPHMVPQAMPTLPEWSVAPHRSGSGRRLEWNGHEWHESEGGQHERQRSKQNV